MRQRTKLNEGMWAGDLEDLVLPVVSIDEYESKVDATATVIGFYVRDRDAADDLNRFIQKSPVALIDTDISPAPDQRGYYMVFVELLTNDKSAELISAILDEVKPLASIEKWKMRLRGAKTLLKYDPDVVTKHLKKADVTNRLSGIKDDISALRDQAKRAASKLVRPERVSEYFRDSGANGVSLNENQLTIHGFDHEFRFRVIGLTEGERLMESLGLDQSAIAMDFRSIAECELIAQLLGESWLVMRVDDVICAQSPHSQDAIALERLV